MYRFHPLTSEEQAVIERKATEKPFRGIYHDHWQKGVYVCRRCDLPLYLSSHKFDSSCGWPSYDSQIEGQVLSMPDADRKRTEIVCSRCHGHLGHLFLNEGFTSQQTRHCVNSLSLDFLPATGFGREGLERAVVAGGCFWGLEYWLSKLTGIYQIRAGYIGGWLTHPTYEEVSLGDTGHVEAVEIIFDTQKLSYESLIKEFFNTHDPTQHDGQGPDIGPQYQSVIFYYTMEQKLTSCGLINQLQNSGINACTRVQPASRFYIAEEYHQSYYLKIGAAPYCHIRVPRFT